MKDCIFSRHKMACCSSVTRSQSQKSFMCFGPFLASHPHTRDIFSDIINITLELGHSWLQASLPVHAGGIRIRSAAQLVPSAYLASDAGCANLVQQILPPGYKTLYTNPCIDCTLTIWSQGHNQAPPTPASHHQRAWDDPRVEALQQTFLESSSGPTAPARLLAVATKESGAWLNALPVASLGLRLDNKVVRIAVGLRLSLPLCHPHRCIHCEVEVNDQGTHGLSCRFSRGCHPRHGAVNNVVRRSLEAAKIPACLEPSDIYRSDGKHPDRTSIVPWKSGRVLVWDITCPDTLALSYVALATREAGAVAAEMNQRKREKYAHLDPSHFYVPIAVETLGAIGPEAGHFFRDRQADCGHHFRATGPSVPFTAGVCGDPTWQCSCHPWDCAEGLCCPVRVV